MCIERDRINVVIDAVQVVCPSKVIESNFKFRNNLKASRQLFGDGLVRRPSPPSSEHTLNHRQPIAADMINLNDRI